MLRPKIKTRGEMMREKIKKMRFVVFLITAVVGLDAVGSSMAHYDNGGRYGAGWQNNIAYGGYSGGPSNGETLTYAESTPGYDIQYDGAPYGMYPGAYGYGTYNGGYYPGNGGYYPGNYGGAYGMAPATYYNGGYNGGSYYPTNTGSAVYGQPSAYGYTGTYAGFNGPTIDDMITRDNTYPYNAGSGGYAGNYPNQDAYNGYAGSYTNPGVYNPSTGYTGNYPNQGVYNSPYGTRSPGYYPQGTATYNAPATGTPYLGGYTADELSSRINVSIVSPTGTQNGNIVYFEGGTGLTRDERRINLVRPYWIVTGGDLRTPRRFSGVTNAQQFAPGSYQVEFYVTDKFKREFRTMGNFTVGAPGVTTVTGR